jgi:replicative DNA helicase
VSLDLTTLRLLKYRERYQKLAKGIPKRALDVRTQILLDDFGQFFREFPDAPKVDPSAFNMMFKAKHKELKDEALTVYDMLFKQIAAEDVEPQLEAGLLKRLAAAASAFDMQVLIERYNAGEELDLKHETEAIILRYDEFTKRSVKDPQVRDPIEDLLKAESEDIGFSFRQEIINAHMKPLRPGDFIVIAARPDKGKTTFISDALTFMSPQVDKLYPGQNRSILWFNNEGPGRNIVLRNFQSAINATTEDMAELQKQPCLNAANTERYTHRLREAYAEALGGRPGVLRVMDIHGMWNHEVEALIERYTPAVVVFDMIDNIKFGGDVANNGQRTDQLLETMYQWARMLAVKHDTVAMATSQVSADGDGLQWPTLPMLKDSKTGKQGAADVILTIGTVNDPVLENRRYIGMTKNKRARTGKSKSPQAVLRFDGDRGRYVEE